jgi:multiple sugar transport system ATP-binding protein
VTTVYVTHDQVEAMTLGQRVAVLRGGVLQQCDTPEQLFDHPANLFVAAFIGSPAMNLVEAHGENGEARFGSCRVPSAFSGRFVLGIRPHDLKLGGVGGGGLPARVQVVERLGTETHIVAGIDAPRLRAEALADAVDAAAADDDILLAEDDRASFTVVTDARAPVAVGDRIELSVDPSRLHGFDAETGAALGTSSTPEPVAA